jgi:hypothetical protein
MYERLLEPDSPEVPNCACGREMRFAKTERRSDDAAVKHFQCDSCGRELLLMVWPELAALPSDRVGL